MSSTLTAPVHGNFHEAALLALQEDEQFREEQARRRRLSEAKELVKRLRMIVGERYHILSDTNGDYNGEPRALARIDQTTFALVLQSSDDPYAVAIVDRCQKCGQMATSDPIGEMSEIGQQLTAFQPDRCSHTCRR